MRGSECATVYESKRVQHAKDGVNFCVPVLENKKSGARNHSIVLASNLPEKKLGTSVGSICNVCLTVPIPSTHESRSMPMHKMKRYTHGSL